MSLEQIIINLENISMVVKETSKLNDYVKAVEQGHPNLKTNLADVEHYLEDTLIRLEELRNLRFLNSLDESEAVPLTKEQYNRVCELTKGMVVDFDEELEGDIW